MARKSHTGEGEWKEFHGGMCFGVGFPCLGFFLLVIGIFWLLQSLGFITIEVPWWPIIIILLGIWLILKRYCR